ncbi:MAG: hypothetical protein AAF518_09700 [Spirochaetota bacterium]
MSDKEDHVNKGGLIAFTFSMVFVFAFFAYVISVGVNDNTNKYADTPSQQSAPAK